MLNSFIYSLHVLSVIIWLGGMFFAYQILRPVAVSLFQGKQLLGLWEKVFSGFFPWVWVIVLLLPVTGYLLLFSRYQGFATAPIFIHLMHGLGLVMIGLFVWLFFGPFKALKLNLHSGQIEKAKKNLARIRIIIGFNTLIGIIVVIISTSKLI